MKTKSILFVLLAMSLSVTYSSCVHEIPITPDTGNGGNGGGSTPPPGSGSTCSKDSVYYVNDIQPILISSCAMSGCHDAATHAEGINVTTYAGVMKIVKAGNANDSKLFTEITRTDEDRMPPPPMAAMAADQVAKIKTWINQGAKNNSCNGCNVANYTFSAVIKPMMSNKCQGCHNPNSLGGGIDLSTYDGIKSAALSGTLYGSISWANGYSKMPQGGSKLSDCEIQQVKSWIDAGALNN
ncbi:c-type cytochrome domain-containing protein [Flavihumibacter fluvii]|uniref:c-type cytochrome domain-containing protein n=1 Tax=Flavihumibacter fluvii TaxID=2838157 RepID=UPI001BDEB653|nr:c-type cytochrome domain-containing protein [Flavihumibacter fluvii]ULQ51288.1 c-type cytochrome [Flavihumibacter fluvii]